MRHGLFSGDGDEIEFVEDIEKRFGVAFSEADYPDWVTLGSVYASLVRRLGNLEPPGGRCASQMAFYRLRQAAGPCNAQAKPATQLRDLRLGNPATTMRQLGRCGLDTPDAQGGWLNAVGGLVLIGAILTLGFAALTGQSGLGRWSALTVILAAIATWFSPHRYAEDLTTLGDLARAVARRNPMMLKAHGAGLRKSDVWQSMRALAAEHSGQAIDEIELATPLIQQQLKRYAERAA